MIHVESIPAAPRPRSGHRGSQAHRRVCRETPFIGGPGRTDVDAWDPAATAPAGYLGCIRAFQDLRSVLMDAADARSGFNEVIFAVENLEWALDASPSWGADRLEGIRRRLDLAREELEELVTRDGGLIPPFLRLRLASRVHFFRECALHLAAEVLRMR
ncbi:MAG: hypothetical protein H6744_17550 [Deltaproteobacteria bacterium]|nr:hypothetical protein [Deltaproteobacteria bacterium]MCB9788490.1 hypothetical protein [Deltaproteobacteria bacterium]